MKRLLLIGLLFFLSACSPKIITKMNSEDLNQIIVIVNEHEYKIKEDKKETVFTCFEEEYISKEQVDTVNENYKMILQSDKSEEVYYIESEGTIVKEENEKYYRYSFEKQKLYNQYRDLVGYDVYYGKYLLNEDYIENVDGKMFDIDLNQVKEIIVSTGRNGDFVLLKQERIKEFIQELNQVEYYEKRESGIFGDCPSIYVLFEEDYMGMSYVASLGFPWLCINDYEINSERTQCHNYYLKNDNLTYLLFEIMGENAFNFENYDNYKPTISKEWVEKVMTSQEWKELICEHYNCSWCEN